MTRKMKNRLLMQLSAASMALATTVNMAVPAMAAPGDKSMDTQKKSPNQEAKAPKTNVVYIVIDDMGYSDFGCYGSEIKTPNIDKLAANGLKYNNFNACPLCSPTRASLLTGRDNHAVGMAHVANVDLGPSSPDYRGRIKDSAATVAQILKANGFSTMGVGKWHVAPTHQVTAAGPFDYWPLAKGFERFYGYLDGETDQYDPQLIYDNHMVETPKKKGYQFSADMVDYATQFVTDQVSITPDKPYFLYVAFSAVHSPLQAPKKYIDMYNGVYDKGWDAIRQERFERQKQMGLIPANAELTPRDPKVKAWDTLSADEKKLFARFEQAYAGYLTYADEQIGRIVDQLKATGQYDNTMIVLISDNGGTDSGGDNGLDDFMKSANGVKVSVKDLLAHINDIGGPNFGAVYPTGWGMVSNTPFKGYKGGIYNGGVRDPLIVHWPAKITAKGEVRSQYVHVTDITPTVLDVLNIQAPKTFQGIDQLPMDGTSFAYTFSNPKAQTKHSTQFYTMGADRAIYKDGWKALAVHKRGQIFEQDKWELYNLNTDFAEVHNVAGEYPDTLKTLQEVWSQEAQKHNASLQEMSFVKMAGGTPGAVNDRNSFKYFAGVGPISSDAAPKISNRSYTITAFVTRSDKSKNGVLVALGDRFAGYTLYVKNNRLVYEYDNFGKVYKVESNIEVPVGASTLKFEFKKTGPFVGVGYLYINDTLAGEVAMPQTCRASMTVESLDIGLDRHTPVSKAYEKQGEFPFSGNLSYVAYDLKNDQRDAQH
ncbi:MAG: type phosphodiesterase / nucleotide pyrophosphatase family protein [Firmicutes bacterium]|nr:type phosphodiesterase / nucleotide pyrophosphatase family protein [Bacillota bacterium]